MGVELTEPNSLFRLTTSKGQHFMGKKSLVCRVSFALLATLLVPNLASAVSPAAANSDLTGLVGKAITPKALPKGANSNLTDYGNDYFSCGGAVIGDRTANLGLTILRKGIKTKCDNVGDSKLTLALERSSSDNKTIEFLDTVKIDVPKGYDLMLSACQGADVAISKMNGKEFYTEHKAAWRVVGTKLVPVADLKTVKCADPAF